MTRTCGTMVVHEWLCETLPGYREARLAAEAATRERITIAREEVVTLPTVVHVVHRRRRSAPTTP